MLSAPSGRWFRLRQGGREVQLPSWLVWFGGHSPGGLSSGLEELSGEGS